MVAKKNTRASGAKTSKPAAKAAGGRKQASAKKSAQQGASSAPQRLVPCSMKDDVLILRGEPGELVGVASIEHAERPDDAAFKMITTDMAETRFGYEQRKRFAPLKSSSLPSFGQCAPALAMSQLPAEGSTGQVPVRLALDPHTPPGTYDAVFDVAGSEQRAKIEVMPVEKLGFMPRSISITAAPGEVIEERIVIVNEGNATQRLGVLGSLVLQEEEQVCLSIQRSLAEVKKSSGGEEHRVFFDAFARDLATKKTDFGRVRIADGPITLAGGDSWCGTIEIHTPRDMTPGAQYRSLLKAHTGQLFVRITARGRSPKAA